MYSIGFPTMLDSTGAESALLSNKAAIRSNIRLVLTSEKLSHFGDPYFGCRLKRLLFEQPHSLIADIMIDEIYTTLITFIPQIFLTRKDIELSTDGTCIYISIKYICKLDNTSDMYTINLTSNEVFKK